MHLHTAPLGKPADDVGMVLIERLLTNVVQTLSVVMPVPITNDKSQDAIFPLPPKRPEKQPDAVLFMPPPTKLPCPTEQLLFPPTSVLE